MNNKDVVEMFRADPKCAPLAKSISAMAEFKAPCDRLVAIMGDDKVSRLAIRSRCSMPHA